VLSFEPHPRDFFAAKAGKPELAPPRIATLRDKLSELAALRHRAGGGHALRRPAGVASPQQFIDEVLRSGWTRATCSWATTSASAPSGAGDYASSTPPGPSPASMSRACMSYEVHGLRVSSSAVREALAAGDLARAAACWAGRTAISGHVLHGRKLGRELGRAFAR
jgi:riboflavin kinase/FMN adenylyltransferase